MNMFDSETQILLLNGVNAVAGFAVNWLLQSTILISIGLTVGAFLRSRGSAVQSLVYRTTLIAVLVCPLATFALASAGFSGWSVIMPQTWAMVAPDPAIEPDSISEIAPDLVQLDAFQESPAELESFGTDSRDLQTRAAETDALRSFPAAASSGMRAQIIEPSVAPVEVAEVAAAAPLANPIFTIRTFGVLASIAGLIWCLVALILTSRLASAWWKLWRLKRSATKAEPELRLACEQLSVRMEVTAPEVYRSPFLPSPCLAGLKNPSILLPEDDCQLSIQDVLIHELAHLRRHDCHWNLLRQIATSVLFFQPLLWVLSRKLEVAAEEVCDDFVVHFGGDRAEYANRLVGIAELSTAPIAAAGVGVVSLRSMLGQRVTRILDTSRTLSTRVSNLILTTILVCGLLGTTMTGMLGLNPIAAEKVTVNADSEEDKTDSTNRFAGKVVDPDGNTVAGADIYFVTYIPELGLLKPTWKPVAITDSTGDFDFSLDDHKAYPDDIDSGSLVAVKEGFGFAKSRSAIYETSGKKLAELREKLQSVRTAQKASIQKQLDRVGQPMRLVPDDQSISGRIVDIEGQSVVGATMTLVEIWGTEDDDLTAWRKAAVEPMADYYSARMKTGFGMSSPQLRSVIKPAITDRNGNFKVQGIGNGRIARLLLEGPTIATTKFYVRTETGEVIELPEERGMNVNTLTYYANKLNYIAGPTAVITGTVRDATSQKPLSGVTIKSQKRHGVSLNGWGADFVRAVTDKDGKYRLVGMPIGSDNGIAAIAPESDIPYLATHMRAGTKSPNEAVEVNFDLPRGLWVEGQITDKHTGKGLSGTLGYYVDQDSLSYELASKMDVDLRQQRRANKDGKYRIAALPGHAYVTFMADGTKGYPRSKFIIKTDGSREPATEPMMRTAPEFLMPVNSHLIAEINPTADAGRIELNLELDGGTKLMARVIDSAGESVEQFRYTGRLSGTSSRFWDLSKNGEIELIDYDHKIGRDIWVVTKDGKHAEKLVLQGEPDADIVVQLQPAGSVKGRLIDDDEEPIAGCELRSVYLESRSLLDGRSPTLTIPPLPENLEHPNTRCNVTDDEGRFEIRGLVPNVKYHVEASKRKNAMTLPTVEGPFESSFSVKSGESKDLGDVKLGDKKTIQAMLLQTSSSKTLKPADDQAKTKIIRGTVTDENDRPIVGAIVELHRQQKGWPEGEMPPLGTTTSGPNGKFELSIEKSTVPHSGTEFWQGTQIFARADGFGPDWVRRSDLKPGEEANLKLVADDIPIHGRLVDLEGKPLPGVSVKVMMLLATENENLDAWLSALRRGQIISDSYQEHVGKAAPLYPPGFVQDLKTDSNGDFTITGAGKERMLVLILEGPTIAYTRTFIATRDVKAFIASKGQPDQTTIHGANCVIAVEPSQAVTGIVKDAKTGEPMAGVAIESHRMTERGISGGREIRVKTDKNGRYTLTGLPKGTGNEIIAVPNDDQPYLMRVFDVPNPTGMKPIQLNLELNRGVWITGNLKDKTTGKNIEINDEAYVYYYPYLTNPFAQATPEYNQQNFDGYQLRYKIAADGTYRLVGLPGKAIVGALVARAAYPQGQGASDIAGADEDGHFPTYQVGVAPSGKNPTILREINIAENEETFELDFSLEQGKKISIATTDPAGNKINGVNVQGLSRFSWWEKKHQSTFEATGFRSGDKRTMLFHHVKRKIGKVVRVTVDDEAEQNLSVQLQPCVTVRGRLIDKNEEPISGATIGIGLSPSEDYAPRIKNVSTNSDGRFEHSEILPGTLYSIGAEYGMDRALVARKLEVNPGETIDLGTINVSQKERPEPMRTKTADLKTSAEKTASDPTTICAVIALPDGSPADETHVALTGYSKKLGRTAVFASGMSDKNGECTLTFTERFSSNQDRRLLVARKDGLAVGWKILNQSNLPGDKSIKISLHEQGVIKGRLVDIDGQGAAGEKIQVESVMNLNAKPGANNAGVSFRMGRDGSADAPPEAWIQPLTTDQDGRFELTGIPENFGAYIKLSNSKKFAPQGIAINTGQPEQRGPNDATYRSLVKNVEPGEEAVLTLSSAKIFTGKVTYEDTNEPVANAKISIWASQQKHGSMVSVTGKTDASGNYLVLPEPGIRFGVSAYPPSGTAYMGRKVDTQVWENADTTRKVDIKLPRVTLVKGRVIEKGTGKPVVDATITFESSDRNAPKNAITGWQAQQKTNDEGEFSYAVPPGQGTLVVRKPDSAYVLQTMDSRKMTSDKPGGARFYANAFHKIKVEKDIDTIAAEIEVLLGKTVRGVIVDEEGNSVEEFCIVTRLKSWDLAGEWSGDSLPTLGGKFELKGLLPGETYKVHFLEPRRKLGTTVELKSTDEEVKVVLQACGSAKAKFNVEDEDNRALLKQMRCPPLLFTLTPGVAKYDFDSRNLGLLAADEDFNANIDRVNYYRSGPQLDDEFSVTYPALIPGATYRLQTTFDRSWGYKEFTVKPGETLDLGEFTPKFND